MAECILESSFLTWNSIPCNLDENGQNVVFTWSSEGQAKLTIAGQERRFHLIGTGGEKFDAGPDYLDWKTGNYFDCYAHVNLRDDDGDKIVLNSIKIDNQDFIMEIAGGTGKWRGTTGELNCALTFIETRKTPGQNPAIHYWCVYAFEGSGKIFPKT